MKHIQRIAALITAAGMLLLQTAPAYAEEADSEMRGETQQYAAGEYPRIYISTAEGVGEKLMKFDGYAAAELTVVDTDGSIISDSGQVKVRGNSTSWLPKKPYTIKFDAKHDVLGMGSARKFILLANCMDPTMLRNYTMFELAKELDIPYAGEHAFTEVWVDGVYKGCYELTEPVQAGKNRVNIDIESNDGMQDFLIQYEAKRMEPGVICFHADQLRFALKEPEDASVPQRLYVQRVMAHIVETVKRMDYDEIRTVLDTESFAKYYLLNEYLSPVDFGFSSVFFFYKDGMLYAGPPWDYDLSAGSGNPDESADYLNAERTDTLFAAEKHFYYYLCRIPEFMEEVRQIYAAHRPYFQDISADDGLIDRTIETYSPLIKRNFHEAGWEEARQYWHLMRLPEETYENNVAYLKSWLSAREIWLAEYFDLAGAGRTYIRGDLDADGNVTAADSQAALEEYLSQLMGAICGLTPGQAAAADINGDGSVTAADSQMILIYYLNYTILHHQVKWEQLLADAGYGESSDAPAG